MNLNFERNHKRLIFNIKIKAFKIFPTLLWDRLQINKIFDFSYIIYTGYSELKIPHLFSMCINFK